MTVLLHALCEDDFHQTPVSIIFSEKCSKFFFFWFCGRCNTGHILCWHLSGLSELPLEQRRLLLLAGEPFAFFFPCGGAFFFPFLFCFCGPFLYVRACRQASTAISRTQHSLVQGSQPCTEQQSKHVSTRARQRKQTELARASMSSSIYTAPCLLKTR